MGYEISLVRYKSVERERKKKTFFLVNLGSKAIGSRPRFVEISSLRNAEMVESRKETSECKQE